MHLLRAYIKHFFMAVVMINCMFVVGCANQLQKANDEFAHENYHGALPTYESFAKQGDAMTQANLCSMYWMGVGVEKNEKRALFWCSEAAKQNNPFGEYYLAIINDIGEINKNKEEAERLYSSARKGFLEAAKNHDAAAARHLAEIYIHGLSVTEDKKQGFDWYLQAAKDGDLLSQYNVGYFYENGLLVDKNIKESLHWYTKAADQGFYRAQDKLGDMLYGGIGGEQNHQKAFEWYLKAAEQGYAKAQNKVAMFYRIGDEVVQDDKKAFDWFSKAADQGDDNGQFFLGLLYSEGRGVTQSDAKSFYWYSKSAEQGNSFAQNTLAFLYADGCGVTQNYVEAYKWISLAKGHYPKNNKNDTGYEIVKKMTAKQISEGKTQVSDWIKNNTVSGVTKNGEALNFTK